MLVRVFADASAPGFLEFAHGVDVEAPLVDDVPAGVAHRDDGAAQLGDLLCGVDGDVAGAGDDDLRAVEGTVLRREHAFGEEHEAVPGGFGSRLRATPGEALAREHSGLVAVGDALVLAEEEADLAAADADVAGGHVRVFTDVAVQLRHERLAETHDLGVGAALRVEVGAALAAADGHAGERVLEDLFEAEELDDAEVDAGVEAQATLVWPERRVELDAESAVHLHAAVVVDPRHAEDDLTLGLRQTLDDARLDVVGASLQQRAQAGEHLVDSLVELSLSGVAAQDRLAHGFELGFEPLRHVFSSSWCPATLRADACDGHVTLARFGTPLECG